MEGDVKTIRRFIRRIFRRQRAVSYLRIGPPDPYPHIEFRADANGDVRIDGNLIVNGVIKA